MIRLIVFTGAIPALPINIATVVVLALDGEVVALSSILPDIPGTAMAGLAGVLYLLLISVVTLAAIFSERKSRRDVAKEVARNAAARRRRDR